MSINSVLRKIALFIEKKNDAVLDYPVEKQQRFLENMKLPENDIERSFCQYRCQNVFIPVWYRLAANLFALLYLLMKLIFNKNKNFETIETEAVFISLGISNKVIPNEVREEYNQWAVIQKYDNQRLTRDDKKYVLEIWKAHPFSWLFVLKCMIKIQMYSALIAEYSPQAIVVCNEYSYTSSVLTHYCDIHNINHINVMHGEKLYFMRDSFFRFTQCYVWDKEYEELFLKLRAEKEQFKVAIPPSLLFDESINIEKEIDYTYYLQAQDGTELEDVVKLMKRLTNNGCKVAIRPHPRYTNIELLVEVIGDDLIEIENNEEISIEESILRTQHVISVYSTVLQQAHFNNVSCIIDDISDKDMILKLLERDYFMLKCEHNLLSDIVEEKL